MGLIDTFGASVKAAVTSLMPAPQTPFSNIGGNMGMLWGDGVPGSPYAHHPEGHSPAEIAGNGIVTACVSKISKAFASAPPILERHAGNDWKRVDHPIINLLNCPNNFYGADHLWDVTLRAEIAGGHRFRGGNGFWRVVMNRARTEPVQIWWEPIMQPVYDSSQFIDRYMVRVDGRPYPVLAAANYNGSEIERLDYAIHFRYEIDQTNPRWGWTPLDTVTEQLKGDNRVAIFHNAIMENAGVFPIFLSNKDGKNEITPSVFDAILNTLRSKYKGRGAGGIAGSNLPVDVHKVGYSPEELAIEKLVHYYEARVCAVLNVPAMVAGLQTGDGAKTYSNYAQADEIFWSHIVILQDRHGSELESQLFPLFGLDRAEYRIGWDRSQVQALQEDEDAKHARVREDYKARLIDLFAAQTSLDIQDVPQEYKGVFYSTVTDAEKDVEEEPVVKPFALGANGSKNGKVTA